MNLEDIPSTQDFDRSGLLKHVLDQFKISRDGDHGPGHWARVRLHGLKVGGVRGADLLVVELFAFLHDSQRLNEYSDPLHGARAADFAASGLIKVYREIKAFAEHAKLYERMHLALQLTLPRLDAAIKDGNIALALELIRELGLEALAENGNWLLMHRERPVLVRGIG